MRGSIRFIRVFGIDIDIHITFFLLLGIFFLFLGINGLILILGVFLFVTIHELCHGLAARYFGLRVTKITLLPIGGIASMSEMPTKPYQELIISLAGPLSNALIVIIFYFPLHALLGEETLMYPIRVLTGQAEHTGQFNVIAHIYWINLVLAVFNMIPAFPMDGGRVLRAILSYRMGRKAATQVAVRLGHIFALLFAYVGIVYGHIFLLLIAVFIYMAASGEGMQVEVSETIKNYFVHDILTREFVFISKDTPLSKALELIFHTHQEDFPVVEDGHLVGMLTRREVIQGLHERSKDTHAEVIMRTDIPPVSVKTNLDIVRKLMQKHNAGAIPVERNGKVVGVVTQGDINKVYMIAHK